MTEAGSRNRVRAWGACLALGMLLSGSALAADRGSLPVQVPMLLQSVMEYARAGQYHQAAMAARIYAPLNPEASSTAGYDPLARIDAASDEGDKQTMIRAAQDLIIADILVLLARAEKENGSRVSLIRECAAEYAILASSIKAADAGADTAARAALKEAAGGASVDQAIKAIKAAAKALP